MHNERGTGPENCSQRRSRKFTFVGLAAKTCYHGASRNRRIAMPRYAAASTARKPNLNANLLASDAPSFWRSTRELGKRAMPTWQPVFSHAMSAIKKIPLESPSSVARPSTITGPQRLPGRMTSISRSPIFCTPGTSLLPNGTVPIATDSPASGESLRACSLRTSMATRSGPSVSTGNHARYEVVIKAQGVSLLMWNPSRKAL